MTSRQPLEKVKCLYENLMSNNFRKTAVLKKIRTVYLSLLSRILQKKILGCYVQPHALEALLKIFYAFVCKSFSGCRYVENLKQASGEIQAQVWPQKFVSRILCYVALV